MMTSRMLKMNPPLCHFLSFRAKASKLSRNENRHQGGKGEREVQSEPFDISAVGVRGQILVPTNRSRDARSLLSTIAEFGAPSDGLKSTLSSMSSA